jgi:hypothetical protein
MGDWKEQSIERERGRSATPRTFKCSRCAIEEEALPSGMDDAKGATHFVYSLPQGWWGITTREGMKLFCPNEAVTIREGEVLEEGGAEMKCEECGIEIDTSDGYDPTCGDPIGDPEAGGYLCPDIICQECR